MMTRELCMRCYFTGKVQGVFFRSSTKKEAEKLDLAGWAKNLEDGRVEVIACGNEIHLDKLFEWLKKGPPGARVDEYRRENLCWQSFEGFEVF